MSNHLPEWAQPHPIRQPDEIWQDTMMPGNDVVLDFSEAYRLTPEQREHAQWEAVDEGERAEHVPGYPNRVPSAQWRVTSGEHEWMIFQWWSGSGAKDNNYLYESIRL